MLIPGQTDIPVARNLFHKIYRSRAAGTKRHQLDLRTASFICPAEVLLWPILFLEKHSAYITQAVCFPAALR